jgi:hypothetical protein
MVRFALWTAALFTFEMEARTTGRNVQVLTPPVRRAFRRKFDVE